MPIPQALKDSRTMRGLSQSDMDVPVSQQMISAIEKGTRPMSPDMARILAKRVDHPHFHMESARELTGFGPAFMNGPNVDLHRASVRERTLEELDEAIEAIQKFRSSAPPGTESASDKHRRYEHLMQCFDGIVALNHYIGIQCIEYEFSMVRLSDDHYNKLRAKGYVKA